MRLSAFFSALILALALLSVPCLAEISAKEYSIDYNIDYGKAVVYNKMIFNEILNSTLTLPLPEDADAISVYIDGKKGDVMTEDSSIVIPSGAKTVEFNYITRFFLDKSTFITDFSAPFGIDSLKIKVVLPPKATVLKQQNSVVPKDGSYSSDGQSIILNWNRQLNNDESLPLMVRFSQQRNPSVFLIPIIILLAGFSAYLAFKKLKVKREIETRIVKEIVKEDMVEKHLKEDEEQVMNVLKQREGSCEQGTLGVVTGFPKATLSRILKELEDRNVISKQKKGKKNLVFLRK